MNEAINFLKIKLFNESKAANRSKFNKTQAMFNNPILFAFLQLIKPHDSEHLMPTYDIFSVS
jgi:hypothetical protein